MSGTSSRPRVGPIRRKSMLSPRASERPIPAPFEGLGTVPAFPWLRGFHVYDGAPLPIQRCGMKIREALTFDDVLLEPAASSVLPTQTDTRTKLTSTIELGIP